jgi:hypothetical protein
VSCSVDDSQQDPQTGVGRMKARSLVDQDDALGWYYWSVVHGTTDHVPEALQGVYRRCEHTLFVNFPFRPNSIAEHFISWHRPFLAGCSGNFTPSPSQIPNVILSPHPARAIARRLPPSAEIAGSSRFDPVGPCSMTMIHPLRSMGVTCASPCGPMMLVTPGRPLPTCAVHQSR